MRSGASAERRPLAHPPTQRASAPQSAPIYPIERYADTPASSGGGTMGLVGTTRAPRPASVPRKSDTASWERAARAPRCLFAFGSRTPTIAPLIRPRQTRRNAQSRMPGWVVDCRRRNGPQRRREQKELVASAAAARARLSTLVVALLSRCPTPHTPRLLLPGPATDRKAYR